METDPSNVARCQDWSPRQIWLSVRKLVETVAATSYPGSKSHTCASPSATISHHDDAFAGAPDNRNAYQPFRGLQAVCRG